MGIKRKFSYSSTPCQTTQLRFLFKQYAINAPSLQQGTARNAGKAAAQYYYIKSFDFYFLLTTVIKDLSFHLLLAFTGSHRRAVSYKLFETIEHKNREQGPTRNNIAPDIS